MAKKEVKTDLWVYELLQEANIHLTLEKNVLFGLAAVATILGRWAADVCLFACSNFGFVHLPDKYTTGSSIMPYKKNPDIFELIRAKCNHLQLLPCKWL